MKGVSKEDTHVGAAWSLLLATRGALLASVWDVAALVTRVHGVDSGLELLVHETTLEFVGRCQFVGVDGQIAWQDGEFLDLGGVVRDNSNVLVGLDNGLFDGLDDCRALSRSLFDGGDGGVHSSGGTVEDVGSGLNTGGALGLQGDERDIVLALVADHDDVGDRLADQFDVILDRDGGDVLTTGANDQLFVSTSDVEQTGLAEATLVAGVEPALRVDGALVLALDLLHVLFAHVGVGHVTHHDVAATVAQLTLLFLSGVEHVLGTRALDVLAIVAGLEDLHLDARNGETARTPHVRGICGPGAGARAFGHAVHLVDLDTERAEVLQGLDLDGSGTGEAELHVLQTEGGLDLLEHEAVGHSVTRRLGAGAAELARASVQGTTLLGPGGDLLAETGGGRANALHGLLNLFPDAGNAEEDGGLDLAEAVAEGANRQIVGAGERQGHPSVVEGTDAERGDDVNHHTGHVREGQVRKDALLLGGVTNAADQLELRVEQGAGFEDNVVVRAHDSLRVASGTGGVNDGAAVAGLDGGLALGELGVRDVLAELQELVPGHQVHFGTVLALVDFVLGSGSPSNHGLDLRGVVNNGKNGFKFAIVLNEDGTGARLADLEQNLIGGVRGVDTCGLGAGEDGAHFGDDPLGGVETPDVHGIVLLDTDVHEGLGDGRAVVVVLLEGPGAPLLLRERRGPALVLVKGD